MFADSSSDADLMQNIVLFDTVLPMISCSHMEVALLTAEKQDNDVGVIQYALQVMYFLLWVSLHVLLWPLYRITKARCLLLPTVA